MTTKFNPYITFNGNCEQAFNFYKSVFGGECSKLVRFNETQHIEGATRVPEEKGNWIRHAALPLNSDTTLYGSDSIHDISSDTGCNVKISIITDVQQEAERLFEGLSADGTVKIPLSTSHWGVLYGSLIDKFGVHWLIEVPEEDCQQGFEDNANIHIP